MKNKAKQELENWKMHPDFSFIEVSNLGRVRTLDRVVSNGRGTYVRKGRILKQRDNGHGYLYVMFGKDGKAVNKSVHRLVAKTFLPNPNNLPQINHKDCNPSNNYASNLEWCTGEYNMQYKEKYGKSAAEALGCPVYAINLETQEKLWFESQMKAGRELGINFRNICDVLKGRQKTAKGFWFTEDGDRATEITRSELRNLVARKETGRPLYAVNLITSKVLWFPSQMEASQALGIGTTSINQIIKGRYQQAGGYWFVEDSGDGAEINNQKLHEIKTNMRFRGSVYAINVKTLEILKFSSQTEAGRALGIDQQNISRVARGQRKQTKGFWFTYANGSAVEATRVKFGDDVATKVEALMVQT